MVRQSTILKTIDVLKLIYQSGLSIHGYFKSIDKNPNKFYEKLRKISDEYENKELDGPEVEELLDLVNKIRNTESVISDIQEEDPNQLKLDFKEEITEDEVLDTDEKVEASLIRDESGKISGYRFKVYRRDKTPVTGVLSREEMQTIYRLQSYYGASITQREVSRHFPDYSLMDFKRILRAFNITKASGPFAPHMYEEKSEEELKEMHLREKENDFLKKIEKDELRDLQATATKLARKNRDLERIIDDLSKNITITVNNVVDNVDLVEDSDKSMIVYLADMHIGAKCESDTLYPNPYDAEEIHRRLNSLINNISKFGHLDELVICLMGDSIDGMDNQTARRDHYMPQCMDNTEQIETFIELTVNFIDNCTKLANNVKVYSVKCGNHGGAWEFTANKLLQQTVKRYYPAIDFILFNEFIGDFEFKGHNYLICHGRIIF